MPSIKITEAQAEDLFFEDGGELYELVKEGRFTDDGKYQHSTSIYQEKATGKFYSLDVSRSGSYYTDWHYSWPDEIREVKQVEKTIIKKVWEEV